MARRRQDRGDEKMPWEKLEKKQGLFWEETICTLNVLFATPYTVCILIKFVAAFCLSISEIMTFPIIARPVCLALKRGKEEEESLVVVVYDKGPFFPLKLGLAKTKTLSLSLSCFWEA